MVQTSELKTDNIIKYLEKNCPSAYYEFLNGKRIYRGMPVFEDVVVGSMPTNRRSMDGSNYFTCLFDNVFSSWEGFPRRSKSWICSSSKEYARRFGNPYLVFPLTTSTFGIAPSDDIWHCFNSVLSAPAANYSHQFSSLDDFSVFFFEELTTYIDMDTFPKDTDPKSIVTYLNELHRRKEEILGLEEIAKSQSRINQINYFIPSEGTIVGHWNYLFSAYKHKFYTVNKFRDLPDNIFVSGEDTGRELWFSGDAVFVSSKYMNSISSRKIS